MFTVYVVPAIVMSAGVVCELDTEVKVSVFVTVTKTDADEAK